MRPPKNRKTTGLEDNSLSLVDDGAFDLKTPHNGVAAGLPWQLVRNILHITLGKLLPERYEMICYYLSAVYCINAAV